MKKGVVVCGPDVAYGPLALLSGTFEMKVQKAAHLGYDGIELMVRDPAGLDWQAVKNLLQEYNLEVPQIVTGELFGADGLCLVTTDEALYHRAEARLRSIIDLAEYLGSMVNIGRVRGRLDQFSERLAGWEAAVVRLREIARYAAPKGVKINLEPLNRYESDFILTAQEGGDLIQDIGEENVGLMMDLFHMNIEETSFADGFGTAGDRLFHVHIADSNRNYPGSGHMDFQSAFQALADLGYDGYISAELRPLPDADTAAEMTIKFLNCYF